MVNRLSDLLYFAQNNDLFFIGVKFFFNTLHKIYGLSLIVINHSTTFRIIALISSKVNLSENFSGNNDKLKSCKSFFKEFLK